MYFLCQLNSFIDLFEKCLLQMVRHALVTLKMLLKSAICEEHCLLVARDLSLKNQDVRTKST